jgi:hypothetical protein
MFGHGPKLNLLFWNRISKPTPLRKGKLTAKAWVQTAVRMISGAKLKVVSFQGCRALRCHPQFAREAGDPCG